MLYMGLAYFKNNQEIVMRASLRTESSTVRVSTSGDKNVASSIKVNSELARSMALELFIVKMVFMKVNYAKA